MDRPSHCLSAVCNGASLRGLFMPLADSPGLRISPLLHLSPQRAHLPHVPPESNTMQYNTSHSPQKFPHKKIPPNQPQAIKRALLYMSSIYQQGPVSVFYFIFFRISPENLPARYPFCQNRNHRVPSSGKDSLCYCHHKRQRP